MSRSLFALSLGILVAMSGCSPSSAPTTAPNEPATLAAPAAAAPTEPSAASTGWRDLEAVNLCVVIGNIEVANLLGVEPTRGDLEGVTGPKCSYQVTPDGGVTVQNIFVYLYGEDLAEVSLTLARDAGGAAVEGLGDEAYMVYEAGEGQYRLTGIRNGDFGFEILCPDDAGAIRLAELILERLQLQA
jgi:hypothetical protein